MYSFMYLFIYLCIDLFFYCLFIYQVCFVYLLIFGYCYGSFEKSNGVRLNLTFRNQFDAER